jgi:hypothetical protein
MLKKGVSEGKEGMLDVRMGKGKPRLLGLKWEEGNLGLCWVVTW